MKFCLQSILYPGDLDKRTEFKKTYSIVEPFTWMIVQNSFYQENVTHREKNAMTSDLSKTFWLFQ